MLGLRSSPNLIYSQSPPIWQQLGVAAAGRSLADFVLEVKVLNKMKTNLTAEVWSLTVECLSNNLVKHLPLKMALLE